MLQVSRLADYATVLMVYMAKKINELHNARDIAANTHISLPTVSKILKLMVKANLLISTRGVKGGYSLAQHPKDISVAAILQAVDGDFGMTTCSHADGDCQLEPYCSVSSNWQLISQTILNGLQSLTLEQMTKPIKKSQSPVQQEIFIDALEQRGSHDSAN